MKLTETNVCMTGHGLDSHRDFKLVFNCVNHEVDPEMKSMKQSILT